MMLKLLHYEEQTFCKGVFCTAPGLEEDSLRRFWPGSNNTGQIRISIPSKNPWISLSGVQEYKNLSWV